MINKIPPELKRKWEDKIGIPDIEARDPRSTFRLPSKDHSHGLEFVHLNGEEPKAIGVYATVWDTDTYIRSHAIESAINAMPKGKHRETLQLMHDSGPISRESVARFSSWRAAMNYWHTFCDSVGVGGKMQTGHAARKTKAETPAVRNLSASEISKLRYRSPRELP